MKVALLHYDFKMYAVSLANGLADKVDLTIIHPEKLSADCDGATDDRVNIYNFQKPRARSIKNLKVARQLFQYIRDLKPDILHVQATGDPWFDTALLYDHLPPMVTTVHDVFPHPGDRFRVPGSGYTNRIPYYRSKHLIVHALPLKDQLQRYFNRPSDQVSILQIGELGNFYRHWSDNKPVEREANALLFFGRIWPYKGLRYLIEAMPLIEEVIPDVKLIIAGRGENLQQHFPNGVDPKRYEILDRYIAQSEVAALFQRSTVTVLPYVEASQSGVAALSYGFGVPVIASRAGALSDMIRDEQDGLLVPPGDARALAEAIVRFLKDAGMQERMRAAALVRCQTDLNWSNIAAETVQVYQHVLGQQ
jgi:glycosyltransferase involved in cell wall biosynthesis